MKYVATICLLAFAGVASAALVTKTDGITLGQIQGMSAEADSLAAEIPGLTSTVSATLQTDANLKKEAKVYTDDQAQKLGWVKQAIANVEATVKEPARIRVENDTAAYNARCSRQFDRDTEMDAYNQCVADLATLTAEREQYTQWWQNYALAWNAKNVAPINAVIVKQNERIAVLNAQAQTNADAYNRATERMKTVTARITEITGIIRNFCNTSGDAETLKWCHSVDWDGASRSLAPLNRTGTGGISPNQ